MVAEKPRAGLTLPVRAQVVVLRLPENDIENVDADPTFGYWVQDTFWLDARLEMPLQISTVAVGNVLKGVVVPKA